MDNTKIIELLEKHQPAMTKYEDILCSAGCEFPANKLDMHLGDTYTAHLIALVKENQND